MATSTLSGRVRTQLLSLLPEGAAFLRSPSTTTYKLLEAIAEELARARTRIDALTTETLPHKTVELLSDWEEVLGLPDPAAPAPTTIADRQAAVEAKLLDRLGHTVADIESIVESLGYTFEGVTRYQPFKAGSRCGQRLTNRYWSHTILIDATGLERDALIVAALERIRRAHATFLFDFAMPGTLGGDLPMELG